MDALTIAGVFFICFGGLIYVAYQMRKHERENDDD